MWRMTWRATSARSYLQEVPPRLPRIVVLCGGDFHCDGMLADVPVELAS